MKYLLVLFLAGLALASAIPLPSSDTAVDKAVDEVDLWLNVALLAEEDDDIKTELGKKLREHLNQILEKVREAIEKGKDVREEVIEKFKEIRQKLKDLRIDIGEKAREYLKNLKDKVSKKIKDIIENLGLDKRDTDEPVTEIGKELKKQLDELLAKIKDAIEHGRSLKGEYIEKLKELLQKLRDEKVKVGQKVREFLEKVKEKVKEYFRKLLDRLDLNKRNADDEPQTELGKRLREEFDKLLEKLKDAVDKGKEIKESTLEKLKEVREQLKDLKLDISKKAKEHLKNLKDKAKDYWNKLIEKLKQDKRSLSDSDVLFAERNSFVDRIKSAVDSLMNVMKDRMEKGRDIPDSLIKKMKKMLNDLEALGIDMKDKVAKFFGSMEEKGKEILERLGLNKETFFAQEDDEPQTELGKTLRKHFDDLLEKVKEAIEHGKTVREDTLEKMKEIRGKLKEMKEDIGNKARELMQKIKEKSKDYFKNLLEKLGLNKRAIDEHTEIIYQQLAAEDEENLARHLREKFEEILEKIKDAINKGKDSKDLVEKFQEIRKKLKEIEIGEKAKEIFENLKQKIKDYFKDMMDKLGGKTQSAAQADFNIREYLKELRERMLKNFDPEKLKEYVEKFFGKKSEIAEQVINILKDKGEKAKQKVLDFIDRVLGNREDRSIKEVYEKIKNYFKDLQIELKENFVKFGEWAKSKYEQGLEKGKGRVDNLRKLAKEFIHDTKVISKDVAEQAKEFFQEYKDDLGTIYDDLKVKFRDILGRN